MNSKVEFLEALRRGIAVLAESEQQDILAEYAQHIELKMAGGLTEEEAVKDFGDIRQLIAEILEAYHVNPSYAATAKKRAELSLAGERMKRYFARLGLWFKSAGDKIAQICGRFFRMLRALPGRIKASFSGLSKDKVKAAATVRSTESTGKGGGAKSRWKTGCRGIAGDFKAGFKWLLCAIGWLVAFSARLVWNGALLICAISIGTFLLSILTLLGITAVWMFNGLPIAGSFLCCLGIAVMCCGVLGLGSGLIWRRRPAVCEGEPSPEAQDDCSEKKEAADCEE